MTIRKIPYELFSKEIAEIEQLYNNNQFDKAVSNGEKLYGSVQMALKKNDPDYIKILDILGGLYKIGKRYSEAVSLFLKALEIRDHVKASAQSIIDTLKKIHATYKEDSAFEKALPFLNRALEMEEIELGNFHPTYAETLLEMAWLFYSMGNYSEAAKYCNNVLQIRKVFPGEDHPDYAHSLSALEIVYRTDKKYVEAINIQLELLRIIKNNSPLDMKASSAGLNNLANLYYFSGQLNLALPIYEESLAIQKSFQVKDYPRLAAAFQNLANVYRDLNSRKEAVKLYREGLEIRFSIMKANNNDLYLNIEDASKLIQPEQYDLSVIQLFEEIVTSYEKHINIVNLNYAVLLKNLAVLYDRGSRYIEAIQRLELSITIQKDHHGEESRLNDTILLLANMYLKTDKLIEAEKVYKEIIRDNPPVSKTNVDIGIALSGLANVYLKKGLFDLSEEMYTRAFTVAELNKSVRPDNYTTSLVNLAKVKTKKYDFSAAEKLLRDALQFKENLTGLKSPEAGYMKCQLGDMFRQKGEYNSAIILLKEGIELMSQRKDKFDYFMVEARSNLAMAYSDASDYTAADQNLAESEETLRAIYGPYSLALAAVLEIKSNLASNLGDYVMAEKKLLESLKIKEALLGEDSTSTIITLNNLAMTYLNADKRGKAQDVIDRCQLLMPRLEVFYPSIAANCYNTYANIYSQIGAFDTAELFFEKAVTISSKLNGAKHKITAIYISNLAWLYEVKNEFDKAIRYYELAEATLVEIFGDDHTDLLHIQTRLINLYAATGQPDRALELAKSVQDIFRRLGSQALAIGSYRAKQTFVKHSLKALDSFISLVLSFYPGSTATISWLYEAIISCKRFGAQVYGNVYHTYEDRYPLLKPLLEELQSLRTQKANLLLNGPAQGGEVKSFKEIIESLDERQVDVEKELAANIPEFRLASRLNETNFDTILSQLPADYSLVEYVKFDFVNYKDIIHHFGEKKNLRYLAFVLNAAVAKITLIDLGDSEVIEQSIRDFRHLITKKKELLNELPAWEDRGLGVPKEEFVTNKNTLSSLIFEPLQKELASKDYLFIVPDGELNRVSFDALTTSSDKYLIDEYCIGYLSSVHDLIQFSMGSNQRGVEALVIADPNYGSMNAEMMNFDYKLLQQLPGTRVEGEFVGQLLQVKPMLGAEATVSRLKEARSPKVIHIATHGFFLENNSLPRHKNVFDLVRIMEVPGEGNFLLSLENESTFSDYIQTSSRIDRISNLENPFLRSGLAFSNANHWLFNSQISPEASDSILFAEDVLSLKLDNTEMVVLSACETGLGEVKNGLGVFGLRYAFTVAGCRSLVMSLWKIPDIPTQELMTEFYTNLFLGIGRVEALRKAKLSLREKYPHPFYWGGFICQGKNEPIRLVESG